MMTGADKIELRGDEEELDINYRTLVSAALRFFAAAFGFEILTSGGERSATSSGTSGLRT